MICSSEYLNISLFVFSLQESKFRETGVITPEEVVLELNTIINLKAIYEGEIPLPPCILSTVLFILSVLTVYILFWTSVLHTSKQQKQPFGAFPFT